MMAIDGPVRTPGEVVKLTGRKARARLGAGRSAGWYWISGNMSHGAYRTRDEAATALGAWLVIQRRAGEARADGAGVEQAMIDQATLARVVAGSAATEEAQGASPGSES